MKAKDAGRGLTPPVLRQLAASLRQGLSRAKGRLGARDYGREQPAEFYDRRFARRAHWREHYTQSHYYPVWTVVADRLKRAGVRKVVDVGCGPGQLACLLRDQGIVQYVGLDFSPLRLEHARKVCPEFSFQLVDIFSSDFLRTETYDAVVLLEFLEHVNDDLGVLGAIRPGTLVLGTVPNFPAAGHVRHFSSASDVHRRYEEVIESLRVDTVLAKPDGQTFFIIEGRR